MPETHHDVLVLGAGFIGGRVAAMGAAAGLGVGAWTRHPVEGPAFDASRPSDVERLVGHSARCLVVTFPLVEHPALWPVLASHPAHVVLLGTTGSHQRAPVIDEDTPEVAGHPRLASEAAVLASGGTVLRLAGLYGSPRDPLRWLAAGRVGREPRQVNLVHGDDVARLVLEVAADPQPGVFVVSDGERHTWAVIAETAHAAGRLPTLPPPTPPKKPSGFVDPARVRARWPGAGFRSLLGALGDAGAPWPD